DHAEVEEGSAVAVGNLLIEGLGNEVVEDPIELREGDGDEQVIDDRFRDDAAGYFFDGSKATQQTPYNRERQSQAGERREVVVGAAGVSEGVEEARDDPDDADGDDDLADYLAVCEVMCAGNQEEQ